MNSTLRRFQMSIFLKSLVHFEIEKSYKNRKYIMKIFLVGERRERSMNPVDFNRVSQSWFHTELLFSSLDGLRDQSMKSIIRVHRFHWMKGLILTYFVMLDSNRLQTNVTCRLQWKKHSRRHKNIASREAQNWSKVWKLFVTKIRHQNIF